MAGFFIKAIKCDERESAKLEFRLIVATDSIYVFYIVFNAMDRYSFTLVYGSGTKYEDALAQFTYKNVMLAELKWWAKIRDLLTNALDDYEWWNLCQSLNYKR